MNVITTNKCNKDNRTQPRGIAMVLVLIALAMATVLGLSFLNTQATTIGISQNVGNQTRARGIAESAIEMAIDHIRRSDNWRDEGEGTWFSKHALDGGSFTLKVADGVINKDGSIDGDGDLSNEVTHHVVLTAIGYYKGVAHTIKAEITPKAGDATPATIALVVANSEELRTDEGLRHAQLIEWYGADNVYLISARESQEAFDELAKTVRVFLISETITSGDLNTKLLNTGVGVVNEEPALFDEFNLTDSNASDHDDFEVNIINASHPITKGFGLGIMEVFNGYDNRQLMNFTRGNLPSGALPLAENPDGDPSLIVVDAGAQLQNGKAAGRRVFLPWAARDLDFDAFNLDGLKLLKNCLDWASVVTSSPSPALHYDFSEQADDVVHDKYGNVDLAIDRGDSDDAITWVTDDNGLGLKFNQDAEDGTAVAVSSAPDVADGLVEIIKANNAITVQVFFKQDNGSEYGGYLVGMSNMAPEDDTTEVDSDDDDNSGGHGWRHIRRRHGWGYGWYSWISNHIPEYSESYDEDSTTIYYSYGGGSSSGSCGYSRRASSRSSSYRICYNGNRGYYYRRCGESDDGEDEVPDDAPALLDDFSVSGFPNGGSFDYGLYMGHSDGETLAGASNQWDADEPVVMAFTFDSSEGVVNIYKNGELVATENATDASLENWSSQWMTLGNSPSLSRPFVGTLYDVKIWPSSLSASQLKDNADKLLGLNDGETTPQILVLYEFDEVAPNAPQLISQWKLNETTGQQNEGGVMYGGGVSSGRLMSIKENAQISGYRSSDGNWGGSNSNKDVNASTNKTSSNAFSVKGWGTQLVGNALCGQGGNPSSVIEVKEYGYITGNKSAQAENLNLPENFDIPTDGRPAKTGTVEYKGWNQHFTLSSNQYCDDFIVKEDASLTISGDVTIWCKEFELKGWSSRIYVPEGSSLTVYASDEIDIKEGAQLNYQNNETHGVSRVNMFAYDRDHITIKGWNTRTVGNFYAGYNFTVKEGAVVYGTVACHGDMTIKGSSTRIYVDLDQVDGSGSGDNNTTIAADERGVSDGAYTNGPITNDEGKFDTAIRFDGDNDYIVMPHNDAYLINTGTVSFWFKANDLSGTQVLFSKDSDYYDTGGHFSIYLDGSTLKGRLQSTSGNNYVTSTVSANTWHHVAVSFGQAGMKLILDDAIVDTDSYTGGMATNSGNVGNYEPIVIGASSMGSGNLVATPVTEYFNGDIDDVRIYGDPLTTTQVATVMLDGHPDADSAVGLVVKDTGGYGEPLDMTVIDPEHIAWDANTGMAIIGPNRVVSDTPASKITQALSASGELTVEILFVPANLEQIGTIASIGSDAYNLNLSIGQDDEQYNYAQRTSSTGSSGSSAIESGNKLELSQQHLVITYNGTVVSIYRNGELESTTEQTGDLSTWSDTLQLVFGNNAQNGSPWLGFLERFSMYDKALNSLQVEDVFNGDTPRENTQTEALEFHVRWYENP